jgi:hypothetical protein
MDLRLIFWIHGQEMYTNKQSSLSEVREKHYKQACTEILVTYLRLYRNILSGFLAFICLVFINWYSF